MMATKEAITQRKAVIQEAKALLKSGKYDEAISLLNDAFAKTKDAYLEINKHLLIPPTHGSHDELKSAREKLEDYLRNPVVSSNENNDEDPIDCFNHTFFYSAYQGQNDLSIQKLHTDFLYQQGPKLSFVSPNISTSHCGKKRKQLGICSNNFRNNTIGRFFLGFLERLNTDEWHIVLLVPPELKRDVYTEHYESFAADTVYLPQSIVDAQQTIAEQELDLLFYFDLTVTPFTHLLAHARLAPVQFTTWGHPVTSGIPTIDYYLSFDLMEPGNAAEHYTEKLIRLNHFPAWYKPDVLQQSPLTRNYFKLPEEGALYCCGHQAFKFHPDFDNVLANILRKDKRGHIILINAWNPDTLMDTVKKRMQKTVPDVFPRIIFLNRLHPLEYLSLATFVDVHLDPLHFGGGRTSFDLLANDKVIVTWPGEFQRGRVTYACYQLMNIETPIAKDWVDYVDIAVNIANDESLRKELEENIRTKKHKLLTPDSLTTDIEHFMRDALNHCQADANLQE